ncbi:mechanosensitive ion channel [Deinococcus yavapaiensis]|uniref:Putative transporter (Transmembrane protein) n=1 Tax=Deinococcus yavapaiensis KR-236 TaxID=694435 RepID=A0A318SJU1_9DEIO|nr:mechanosensitive ion channel [Deinococcus yavapaiensis]PYE52828.1 putative transporter (transmembrane protein) [Deinococcus yavapaiensis KR-236]
MNRLNAYYNQFLNYAPNLLTAILLIIVAFIVAAIARAVTVRLLRGARVDERVTRGRPDAPGVSAPIGSIVYALVLLFFLPGVLGALGLRSLLTPATNFINNILDYLPNIIGAALILVIGFFVANLLRQLVTTLTATAGVDRVTSRVGLPPTTRLSNLLGLIVYGLVIIPVILGALNALNAEAITAPISNMLNRILAALPNIVAAVAVVGIAWFVGRVVSGIVTGLLANVGFDRLPRALGLGANITGATAPSVIAGYFAQGAIVLFALISAFELLGAQNLADLSRNFIQLIGQILLGLVIFAVGLFLANLFAGLVRGAGGTNARLLAGVARWATVALFGAMALRQMGIANEIVNLAFGLTLGAIAVAFALAFGLGARDTAGRIAERWRAQLEEGSGPRGPNA